MLICTLLARQMVHVITMTHKKSIESRRGAPGGKSGRERRLLEYEPVVIRFTHLPNDETYGEKGPRIGNSGRHKPYIAGARQLNAADVQGIDTIEETGRKRKPSVAIA